MKTIFLRVLEASVDEKAEALRAAISWPNAAQRFDVDPASFEAVPKSPFAYWVSEQILRLFARVPPLNGIGRLVVSTNPLNDDFRYARGWWEPAVRGQHSVWCGWAKGGPFAPVYYDIPVVITWDERRGSYTGFLGTESRQRERPVASVQHFFRPGISWPRRTNGLSFRLLPRECIFGDKGPAAFVEADREDHLLALTAVTNGRAFGVLVSLQLARTQLAQSYEVGLIQQTPVPELETSQKVPVAGGWWTRRPGGGGRPAADVPVGA